MPSLEAVLDNLYARTSRNITLGLERMEQACTELLHPEHQFPVIHVAGTNGKGSVCAMVESIARIKGLTTGLYTSPHLCHFNERIRIQGEPIDSLDLADVLDIALSLKIPLSFFECATLAAFLAFQRASVDIAILEVGLGGRLDATNVIPPPLACAITRIAYDHTALLGSTLSQIAREKAGIAKKGSPLVLGSLVSEAKDSIEQYAHAVGATVMHAEEDEKAARFIESHPSTGLPGRYQLENAKIAYVLGSIIGATPQERAKGIASAQWPARLETVQISGHSYLFDAAHNPDGARVLAEELQHLSPSFPTMILLFGALADKNWREMLDTLAPLFQHRIYVEPPLRTKEGEFHRAPAPAEILSRAYPGQCANSIPKALELILTFSSSSQHTPLIVVCGSIYLVGYVRALLLNLDCDPLIPL
ncbi:bifunctional folylpolyglutamate synthase/dihydrofolate synthase [Pajaroellobacter abortibovis]|uniref:Dihydrofolate synthase/folylpolyglutamate synthase n=1 Tax=Pajaroellobacter abortibovis TaxID=1882918 RepID=A0A1L6MXP4_9BACT|nr:folylpolyglutamate synthase/dihydrofolate synthase family protein [Pajaroellobacter abortibovis]APS00246.1 hypothetical protein BCY86_05775 [Pajaroellobacter abortibovis]